MLKFENFLKALYEQNDNEDPNNMDYIKNLLVKMSNYVEKHNVGGNVNKIENISNENFEITGIDEKGVNKKYKLKFIKNISGQIKDIILSDLSNETSKIKITSIKKIK
jgi:hypothetical protein